MSCLSFHVHDISRCGFWLLPIVRASGLKWIKQVCFNADRVDYGDNIRVIARPWIGGDGAEAGYIQEADKGADRYWEQNGVFIRALATWAWAIEGPNEPAVSTSEQRRNLAAYTQRLGAIYYEHDIRLVSGNISVGNPPVDPESLAELAPVLCPISYLGLHHYGRPTLARADPWELYRYRIIRDAMGVELPPTFLTEAGVDGTGTPMGQNGWRKAYKRFGDYLGDLLEFGAQLEDDGILGAFIYDAGGDKKWKSYNHEKADVIAILQAQGLL